MRQDQKQRLREQVFRIFHPEPGTTISGLIGDLTRANFRRLIDRSTGPNWQHDHLLFFMNAPIGECARIGSTLYFYTWDYEELGASGAIIGKATIKACANYARDNDRAFVCGDEHRSSFDSRAEMIQYCANRILRFEFTNLTFTENPEHFVTFEKLVKHVFRIFDSAEEDWQVLKRYFRPEDVGHIYLTIDQCKWVDSHLRCDEFYVTPADMDITFGVPTKNGLQRCGRVATVKALNSGSPLGVAFLDVDHFHQVNLDHTWNGGDAAIRVLIEVCNTILRESGVAGIAGRFGGEEFVLVLQDCDENGALRVAEQVRRIFGNTEIVFRGERWICTVSAGVASGCGPELTYDAVLMAAQEAAQQAKKAGRNQVIAASALKGQANQ